MSDIGEVFNIVDVICSGGENSTSLKIVILFFFASLWSVDKIITWVPVLKSKDKSDVVKENIHAIRYGASEIIAYKKQTIKDLERKLEERGREFERKIEEKNKEINHYENSLIKYYHSLVYSCYTLDSIQDQIYRLIIKNSDLHKIEVSTNILLSQSDINQQIQSLLSSLKAEHDFNE